MREGARIVAVGDLNGADDALEAILRGTRLVDARGRWIGGSSELIQMGDIFNRGPGARRAFERLLKLRQEAARAGGRVTVLLGNHEVMMVLRNEAYATAEEYLSFATPAERKAWPARVNRAVLRILNDHGPRGPILPIGPRIEAWKITNAPGRAAMRRELGAKGRLGKIIRTLPIAHVAGGAVFVHAGLLPGWALGGVEILNLMGRDAWRTARFYGSLPRTHLFRNGAGPLWNRSIAEGNDARALQQTLDMLGVRRMVVGHTQTEHLGGDKGRVLLRQKDRLVCVDVGLRAGDVSSHAALVLQGASGWQWREGGLTPLFRG